MTTPSTPDMWEVEANGRTFNADLDELAAWIADGSVLRIDRVRRPNLRWIEAGKVPALVEFFNAKDASEPTPAPITTSTTELLGVSLSVDRPQTFENAAPSGAFCAMHADAPAVYACDTCANSFCKACPTGYGASVKICPFCGAMCRSLSETAKAVEKQEEKYRAVVAEGFGFSDFGKAFAMPFKFKLSLLFGALLYAFFSVGQSSVSMGSIFMIAGALTCFMAANMITFGILGHTIDNFTQGKTDDNFMPSWDDFDIWDDVVHPFFLSIGVYIASFGPFIAVVIVAIFFLVGSVGNQMNPIQADTARAINPELPYAAKAADQSEAVRQLTNRAAEVQKNKVEAIQNGQVPVTQPAPIVDEDAQAQELEQMIKKQRQGQLEGAIGKTPETRAQEQKDMIRRILGYGTVLLVVGGLALLWGIFYFPAACAVAGYTRSFTATLNPSVGLDTIKTLGGSYFLLLVMGLILGVATGFIGGVFGTLFSAFDMPTVGNVPAKALTSITAFYFWVVWSAVIGYALLKKADKFQFLR